MVIERPTASGLRCSMASAMACGGVRPPRIVDWMPQPAIWIATPCNPMACSSSSTLASTRRQRASLGWTRRASRPRRPGCTRGEVLLGHGELALVPEVADLSQGGREDPLEDLLGAADEERAADLLLDALGVEVAHRREQGVERHGGRAGELARRGRRRGGLPLAVDAHQLRGLGDGHAAAAEVAQALELHHVDVAVEAVRRGGAGGGRDAVAPLPGAQRRRRHAGQFRDRV